MTKEPDRDSNPPRWKSEEHQQAYMNSPMRDPFAPVCRWCKQNKHLILNPVTDQYSGYFACQCDQSTGEVYR